MTGISISDVDDPGQTNLQSLANVHRLFTINMTSEHGLLTMNGRPPHVISEATTDELHKQLPWKFLNGSTGKVCTILLYEAFVPI